MIAVENILTRANYFNLSDPTVVLYWRAGRGLEISKRNRGIPPLVQAIEEIHGNDDGRVVVVELGVGGSELEGEGTLLRW